MAELIDLRERLDHIISELGKGDEGGRQWRDYDQPTPDPDAIAERWGVDVTPPTNEPPSWFQERFGEHLPEQPR
jgi:hypothetical protein